MSEQATLKLATVEGDGLRFEAEFPRGTIVMESGATATHPNPVQFLMTSLAACMGIDVIGILRKKRLKVTSYAIEMHGERAENPPRRYTRITLTLQLWVSESVLNTLHFLGIAAVRRGNIIDLVNATVGIEEACSGIRSLMSLTFLSLFYGYFAEKRLWVRWAIFLGSIPIAVAANAFRVSATGVLSEYNPELAQGFFHTLEGGVSFGFAFALMILFHLVLKKLFPVPAGELAAEKQCDGFD